MALEKQNRKKAQESSLTQKTTDPQHANASGSQVSHTGFLDLKIDTAFKFIFRKKQFMMDLLNELLAGEKVITDITYNPTEQVPEYEDGKKVFFDLCCTTSTGEIFIVEMQYRAHDYFKERTLYYIARKIDNQLRTELRRLNNLAEEERKQQTSEAYKLSPTIGVFIMDFHLEKDHPRMFRDVILADQRDNHRRFMDALRMMYVELPSIKREEDCKTGLEYWIYVIENLKNMTQIPFTDKKPIFKELENEADYFKMSPEEREQYDYELMHKNVYDATIVYAKREGYIEGEMDGFEKGKAEGEAKAYQEKLESARRFKNMGLSNELIAQGTGLPLEEINNL